MNDKIDWNKVKSSIEEILTKVEPMFDEETVEAVKHYIKHDEFEMAFEGMFIEIMKLNKVPDIDFKGSKELAQLLNLHKETVFDIKFWDKFERYIN